MVWHRLPEIGQSRPGWAQVRPTLARIRPKSGRPGPRRGRHRLAFREHLCGPRFGTPVQRSVVRFQQTWAKQLHFESLQGWANSQMQQVAAGAVEPPCIRSRPPDPVRQSCGRAAALSHPREDGGKKRRRPRCCKRKRMSKARLAAAEGSCSVRDSDFLVEGFGCMPALNVASCKSRNLSENAPPEGEGLCGMFGCLVPCRCQCLRQSFVVMLGSLRCRLRQCSQGVRASQCAALCMHAYPARQERLCARCASATAAPLRPSRDRT